MTPLLRRMFYPALALQCFWIFRMMRGSRNFFAQSGQDLALTNLVSFEVNGSLGSLQTNSSGNRTISGRFGTTSNLVDKKALIKSTDDNHMAGCLLVMDENFRLIEWLTYHYHVLPLKRLIVAVDPKSKNSPEAVFDMIEKELNMGITTWGDGDFGDWEPLKESAGQVAVRYRHRSRQKTFLQKCMEHLNKEGWEWTALWDTDEYITFMHFGETMLSKPNNQLTKSPSDLRERGSILKHIKSHGEEACYPLYRVLIGTRETNTTLLKDEKYPVHYKRLDTIRFRHRNRLEGDRMNGHGKCLVNVQKVNHSETVDSVHRPALSICKPPSWQITKDQPFLINHYLGSWEAYSYRDDARKGWDRSYEAWWHRSEAASVQYEGTTSTWLQGFVEHVGLEKATRILNQAGLDPDYDASFKKEEFRCVRGADCGYLAKLGYKLKPTVSLSTQISSNESTVGK